VLVLVLIESLETLAEAVIEPDAILITSASAVTVAVHETELVEVLSLTELELTLAELVTLPVPNLSL
jgi:hypothetical protein